MWLKTGEIENFSESSMSQREKKLESLVFFSQSVLFHTNFKSFFTGLIFFILFVDKALNFSFVIIIKTKKFQYELIIIS